MIIANKNLRELFKAIIFSLGWSINCIVPQRRQIRLSTPTVRKTLLTLAKWPRDKSPAALNIPCTQDKDRGAIGWSQTGIVAVKYSTCESGDWELPISLQPSPLEQESHPSVSTFRISHKMPVAQSLEHPASLKKTPWVRASITNNGTSLTKSPIILKTQSCYGLRSATSTDRKLE